MSEVWEQTRCEDHAADAIDLVIRARPRDLGGFTVRRALPNMRRRLVGPFIFFDHMGPADVPAGEGMDVRPHPHIALATITYLFDGAIAHRDSLGTEKEIHPGDVNWMIAGKGIAHSERTSAETRAKGHRLHGIQAWVALRQAEEDREPSFVHHPKSSLPLIEIPNGGGTVRLISGNAFGKSAPVETATPTIYADAQLKPGAVLDIPDGYEERAVYVVSGSIDFDGETFSEESMLIFRKDAKVCVHAKEDSRVMILGGDPIDGPRLIWWNFVARTQERIDQAKADWKEGRFPKVPGDDEFIPLPEDR